MKQWLFLAALVSGFMAHPHASAQHTAQLDLITLGNDVFSYPGIASTTVFPEIHLRGMQAPEDLRLGPVVASGVNFGSGNVGDRQYYLISLRGESPERGYSRIFLRGMTLFEQLKLPALNVTPTEDGQSNTGQGSFENERELRFHQRFISFGLESPIYAELSLPRQFEAGWTAAFTLAQVEFKGLSKTSEGPFADYPTVDPSQFANTFRQNQAQQQTQFFAGELGSYARYYGLYPLVPYISVRALPGSLLDINALIDGVDKATPTSLVRPTESTPGTEDTVEKERGYRSGFQLGALFSTGLEFYLGSRGIVGVEYSYWNWNIGRSEDWTHLAIFKAGFLF